jgi:hypothetical protein
MHIYSKRVPAKTDFVKTTGLMIEWLDAQPEVPNGKWFTRISGMILCGDGNW